MPDVIDDDSDPSMELPIIESEVTVVGGEARQMYMLNEDEQLRARFYIESSEVEAEAFIRSLPEFGVLQLEPSRTVFVYTPNENYFGADSFSYTSNSGTPVSVRLEIASVNDAPLLSQNVDRVAEQGRFFTSQVVATDADDDDLVYSATGLPDWMTLDSETGVLSGLPRQIDIGFSDLVTIKVTDPGGLADEYAGFRFEVIDINDPPTLNLIQLPGEMNARQELTVPVFPDDPDGDAVTVSVEENRFVSASVNEGTVTLTANDVTDVTHLNLVFLASDERGQVTREILPLTLFPVTESGNGITLLGSIRGRGVHVVVLGDGYKRDQQSLFREHAEDVIAAIQGDEGIASHMGAFNIHLIEKESVDSGADDNEQVDSRNTFFDSVYNCREIQRLICANTLTMFETALVEYPTVDQIILLVNDRRYGGSGNSGGSVAITSAYSPEIALHEMGHSLADLADEYVDNLLTETITIPAFQEGRFPNVSTLSDPSKVPWAHWISPGQAIPQQPGEEGVGVFQGGYYRSAGVYRPTYDSRMRTFDSPFGPVNSEEWVLRLYTLTEGIRGFAPLTDQVELSPFSDQEFVINPIFGSAVQSVEWRLNGADVTDAEHPDRLVLNLEEGNYQLIVTVRDISGVIRRMPPHAGIFSWTWNITVE